MSNRIVKDAFEDIDKHINGMYTKVSYPSPDDLKDLARLIVQLSLELTADAAERTLRLKSISDVIRDLWRDIKK